MRRLARRPSGMPPFRAGVIALALVACATYLAFARHVPLLHHPYRVYAIVASGNQLDVHTPVRIAGVDVGKVEKVKRGPGTLATVTMDLDRQALPLHTDATLKIRPRIFIEGNFFIDLHPGTPSAPILGRGGVIPLAQTAQPVQLDQILADLQSSTRDNLRTLLREYARALDQGGAEGFNAALPYWAPAFRGSALVAEASRGLREHDLSGYIAGSARTAAAVARDEHALAELVSGFNQTMRGFAARRADLSRSLVELDGLVREASPAFDALNRLFPPLRAFTADVRPGLRAAPATLRLANPLLAQLQGMVQPSELPALVSQLQPAVASLARLQPRLTDLLHLTRPIIECIRRNGLPTLEKPVSDPPLSTGDPVYLELLHNMPELASAAQNFDGNGPTVRYHAGFGDQMVTFGNVPSVGEHLVGLTSQPIIGSRPRKPDVKPPFEPNVPCITQAPPNLAAATGPAPEQRKVSLRLRPLSLRKGAGR